MRRILFLSLLLCAAALGPRASLAQTQPAAPAAPTPARERLAVTVVQVKPEMMPDFENLIKNEYHQALSKAGAKWVDVWRTAQFGDAFEYTFVAPIESYAQFDGPGPLEKGLGKEGAAAWYAKASRMVNGVRTFTMDFIPELSHETKLAGPPKLGVISFVSVAPGRGVEYESYIRNEMLPVVRRSDVPGYWVQQVGLGGDANQYITLTLHNNFAELEKGPPARRVLGPEGAAKLAQKMPAGVVTHVERRVIRLVPELTYRPAQTSNK